MSTFGHPVSTPATSSTVRPSGRQGATRVTVPEAPITVSKLSLYCSNANAAAQVITGFILADVAGTPKKPGAVLGTTAEMSIPASSNGAWRDASFAVPVQLASTATVWLGTMWGTTTNQAIFAFTSAGGYSDFINGTYPTWTTTGWGSNGGTQIYGVYATYTVDAASACPVNLLKTHIFNKGVIQSG